jgi:hypothetical protein
MATETTTTEATEPEVSMELTDREVLIAQGGDPDETPEVEETAEGFATDSSEVSDADATPQTWLNDDYFALADSYGLSMDDVKSMAGPEELHRMGKVLEGRTDHAPAENVPEEAAEATQREDEPDVPGFKDGKIDPEWFEEEDYDDTTVMIAKQLRSTQDNLDKTQESLSQYKSNSDVILENYAREQQAREINAFHDSLDKLNPEFYGNTIDEDGNPVTQLPAEFADRRQKMLEAVTELATGISDSYRSRGEAPRLPGYDDLSEMAQEKIFPEIKKKAGSAKRAEQLKRQSVKRRRAGSSNGRAVSNRVPRSNSPFDSSELENDPELTKLWNSFAEANGNT